MKDFNSLEYKRSRGAYMAQCTVEYFVALLVTDAFLAKLLTSIGISDSLVGIISSFISLAFVIQLMSIFLVRSKVSTKSMVLFFDTISIFFFMFIYVIPFIPVLPDLPTGLHRHLRADRVPVRTPRALRNKGLERRWRRNGGRRPPSGRFSLRLPSTGQGGVHVRNCCRPSPRSGRMFRSRRA